MKIIFTLGLLLQFTFLFSQWKRVEQLPSSNITSLYHRNDTLYAGGKNLIYFSSDKGLTWDSTNTIPQFFEVDNLIIHNNELYAACFGIGVVKSQDGGRSWQTINSGIAPFVSDFVEFKGDLYAATLGNAVFKLNPANRNSWLSFSNGLSNLSANITSIAGNKNGLVAGTLANGLYDFLPANSITWEERFLLGQIRPSEGVYDIIAGHDSLFLSGSTGRFYLSTDNGLNWNTFGNILPSRFTTIVNAKQALLAARVIFDGQVDNSFFYYIKKDSLDQQFVQFSFLPAHFTYKIEIFDNTLWNASTNGLFYMPLSDLPGISSADDTTTITLPVKFTQFSTTCERNKVVISWKTAQEENGSHFDIERSANGIQWTVIAKQPAESKTINEKSYSFTDNNPLQNGYYRIAHYDLDGRVQYSSMLRSSCGLTDKFSVWPNPMRDVLFINIVSADESGATIRIFDNKGSLVKMQRANVLSGSNQLRVDIGSLANGAYSLSVDWNNGQIKRALQILKQ